MNRQSRERADELRHEIQQTGRDAVVGMCDLADPANHEQLVERSRGRVVLIHLSILFGMAAMAFWETPRTFFIVFIALKTVSDLGWLLPQGKATPEPPAWITRIGRLGKGKDGETFAGFWRHTHETEERTRQENEQVMDQTADRDG